MAHHRVVDGVGYDRCGDCGSIVAEEGFLARLAAGEGRQYDDSYWEFELAAARERCFGNSLPRVAELFLYARRPIRRFLDVSAGAGYLLDAVTTLMPGFGAGMRAIEPFPPPERFRSRHPGYQVGFLPEVEGQFDAGTCIEVIEHIPPDILWGVVRDLGRVAAPGSTWYFNSAQPHSDIVREQGYLDPHRRGHIASYSIAGLRPMFAAAGFSLQPLPGRDWAFLAIQGKHAPRDTNGVLDWIWTPLPENMATLEAEPFGGLMRTIGTEAALAYAMSAVSEERTRWALGLSQQHHDPSTPAGGPVTQAEAAAIERLVRVPAAMVPLLRLLRAARQRLRTARG